LITFRFLDAAKIGGGPESLDSSGFAGAFQKLFTILSTGFVDIFPASPQPLALAQI